MIVVDAGYWVGFAGAIQIDGCMNYLTSRKPDLDVAATHWE
jgi:hypothetical protein